MTPTSNERIAAIEASLQHIVTLATTTDTTLAERVSCVVSAGRRLDELHIAHTVLLEAEAPSGELAELDEGELRAERADTSEAVQEILWNLNAHNSPERAADLLGGFQRLTKHLGDVYAEAQRRGVPL